MECNYMFDCMFIHVCQYLDNNAIFSYKATLQIYTHAQFRVDLTIII